MASARKEMELAVHIGNHPGELAKLLSSISGVGINVLAYCAYSEREQGTVLLVTNDLARTRRTLESNGYACKANPVVLVTEADHVGAVAALGACLGAAGINILYSYASSSGADEFYAVFKTDNDDEAIRLLSPRSI
jgi:hypothetical protein